MNAVQHVPISQAQQIQQVNDQIFYLFSQSWCFSINLHEQLWRIPFIEFIFLFLQSQHHIQQHQASSTFQFKTVVL